MVLYGVAVLALCLLLGTIIGDALGLLIGVDANVGGVGFAMILLVLVTERLRKRGRFPEASEQGVLFWSAMYIPIVVAMAMTQNVFKAIAGGPMAILVGLGALVAGAGLVPVLSRIGPPAEPLPPLDQADLPGKR
ncbi:MAG: malonate transporter subunit MadL [Renibacterium sp.]|nr:malonate transporter subunit MadL [Renibacterium sp.]